MPSTALQACTWPRSMCLFLVYDVAQSCSQGSCRYHILFLAALQVRTQRGVLPDDHPQRASALLERAVACVEGGNRQGALDVLRPMMDEDAEVGGGHIWECASVLPCTA